MKIYEEYKSRINVFPFFQGSHDRFMNYSRLTSLMTQEAILYAYMMETILEERLRNDQRNIRGLA